MKKMLFLIISWFCFLALISCNTETLGSHSGAIVGTLGYHEYNGVFIVTDKKDSLLSFNLEEYNDMIEDGCYACYVEIPYEFTFQFVDKKDMLNIDYGSIINKMHKPNMNDPERFRQARVFPVK